MVDFKKKLKEEKQPKPTAGLKVIIAGSRTITNYQLLLNAIQKSKFQIAEVVSGHAPGVDTLGEQYAKDNKLPLKVFEADWQNIHAPRAIVAENSRGLYNKRAGIDRNEKMGDYADAAIILIVKDGSKGSEHMYSYMKKLDKPVEVIYV